MAYVRGQAAKRPRGVQSSRTHSEAAPVGGLNAVSALANMPPSDALVLTNWFPQPSYIEVRNGYSKFSTGYPGQVETVMGYSNAAGEQLFGISVTSIYNATAGGAVGAAVVTGLTNARWEYTNVATSGGQFLYAGNGVDAPRLYDGTTWTAITDISTPAITGVTTTKLRNPILWKNRVWFVEEGSMRAWYLPTSSIGGAAQSYDLGPIFRNGGKLQVIMTASLTDGSTFDDYIAFMSTEGEVAMYKGTDPASSTTFNICGIYPLGKPIGRRCFFRMGTDTIIICQDGFVSLTKLISIGRFQNQEAISYKILNAVNASVQQYKNNFGWQGIYYPLGNKVLINVPQATNLMQFQYVMNSVSNSWCTFTGWNANCFEVLGDNLYFGGSNFIAWADNTQADNGASITATLKTAFNYMGTDRQKFWKMVRPLITSNGLVNIALQLNTNFEDSAPVSIPTALPSSGPFWDVPLWDTVQWAGTIEVNSGWQTISGVGFSAALYLVTSTGSTTIQLQSFDYQLSDGGIL